MKHIENPKKLKIDFPYCTCTMTHFFAKFMAGTDEVNTQTKNSKHKECKKFKKKLVIS
jgi:hypothetical protein